MHNSTSSSKKRKRLHPKTAMNTRNSSSMLKFLIKNTKNIYFDSFFNNINNKQNQSCFNKFSKTGQFQTRPNHQMANSYEEDADEPKTSTSSRDPIVKNQPYQVEMDIDLDSDQAIKSDSANKRDLSFKFGELILSRAFGFKKRISDQFLCKLLTLKPNGIFYKNFYQIWHEHIVYQSSISFDNPDIKLRKPSVAFQVDSHIYEFSRPTLHEYVLLSGHGAVPSHFSIITLVPWLLEMKSDSKM